MSNQVQISVFHNGLSPIHSELRFKVGEILFGKIRPYFHKVGVAPVDGVCSSDTIVISPKASDYFPIVLACVSSEEFVSHATQTSQGTKMPRANWKVLIKYPVVIPPQPILARFDEFIRDIVDQIQNMIFRNRNLRRTRDLLLPKLISGEVEVGW
ncbi:MAG: restriction endonuclease subunit S [Candidatus Methanospirareceae archaeon]